MHACHINWASVAVVAAAAVSVLAVPSTVLQSCRPACRRPMSCPTALRSLDPRVARPSLQVHVIAMVENVTAPD